MAAASPHVAAALLGDVVGSRDVPDRQALHDRLGDTLALVNERVAARSVLQVTAGDEFQGTYEHLGSALAAGLLVRMSLPPDIDVRLGLGWGAVTVLDPRRGTQDGPAWWAARAAIEWVADAQQNPMTRLVRTAYRRAEETAGPEPHAVNAALLCRDQVLGSLDERSQRILRGLMTGRSQSEVAAAEGISPSAVSQRVRRDGLGVLLAAASELEQVR